jgi:hypothetical protein
MDRIEVRDIKISNHSNHIIYYSISKSDSIEVIYDNESMHYYDRVFPGKSENVANKPRSWDVFSELCDEQKIHIIIISNDTVEKYGWKKVCKENLIDTVIKVGLIDLDRSNWKIKYDR